MPNEVNGLVSNLRDIYRTDLSVGRALFKNPTPYNFEPRVGVAWSPSADGKLSLRAAFGVFDVLPLTYEIAMLEAYSGPFSSLVTLANPPAGSFPSEAIKRFWNRASPDCRCGNPASNMIRRATM